MTKEDLLRQKQMLLIDILHNDAGKINSDSRMSFKTRYELAEMAGMNEEEIDKLIDDCRRMYPVFMAADVARSITFDKKYKHIKSEAYNFVFDTCLRHGYEFLKQIDLNSVEDFCEALAEDYYLEYMNLPNKHPVDRRLEQPVVLEAIIKSYLGKFVENVLYCLGQGYKWDVICKMSQVDLTKKRFSEIINEIAKGD